MTQGVLPFKYEKEMSGTGMTGLAGLLPYLDLAQVQGMSTSIEEHIGARKESQGWTDSEIILSLVLMNLAGGECVEDLGKLESDEGFCQTLSHTYLKLSGMKRKERRDLVKRWRKEKKRTIPSPSAIFRYLHSFHDPEQESLRIPHKAYIPEANGYLKGFTKVNADFLAFLQKNNPERVATLDMDATLVETNKASALFCYKGFRAYQPFNTWWAEQGVIAHSEFRDGNVPAGFEQLRLLKESLSCLPEGVDVVRVRSDTAGYQHDLLKYCAAGKNERFGVIEFAIGCDVSTDFKKAVLEVSDSEWMPVIKKVRDEEIKTNQEWAEVCFVPSVIGHSKKGPDYRYIAVREPMEEQLHLPGIEQDEEQAYPFPTMPIKDRKYKIFGTVTNMDWDGNELINWQRVRCGKSEEAHSIMKEDLAGGKLPSNDFGVNAAWWWIMILSLNLNTAMKTLILGKSWVNRRMKAIRYSLINIPGRIVKRSRYLIVRLSKNNPLMEWLIEIRAKITMLIPLME